MAITTNSLTGYSTITVPCDSEEISFLVERLQHSRICVRIGKTAIFMSYNEAAQVSEAITTLMGGATPTVRL